MSATVQQKAAIMKTYNTPQDLAENMPAHLSQAAKTVIARLMSRTWIDPVTGCWETHYSKDTNGYTQLQGRPGGPIWRAHRLVCATAAGIEYEEITAETTRHHCDNRGCINPAHLQFGTLSENAMDAVVRGRHHCLRKTHCPRGHLLVLGNVYEKALPHRECLTCRRVRSHIWNRANRGQVVTRDAATDHLFSLYPDMEAAALGLEKVA